VAEVTVATAALVAFVSLWAATEAAAAMLGNPAFLGQPILRLPFIGQLYPPWAILLWAWKWRNVAAASAFFAKAMHIFEYPSIVAAALAMGAVRLARVGSSRIHDLHGSSHWPTNREVKATGLLNGDGVYLGTWNGKYLRHDGSEHVLAFAPSRSGKGVGLVIPTLLNWTDNVVVHDIKCENWEKTAGWRQHHLGSLCLRFDPTCTDGTAARFNPLAEVRTGPQEVKDAQNVADILIDPAGNTPRDHWDITAHDLLVGVILHVIYGESNKTLAGCLNFLNPPDRDQESVLRSMIDTRLGRQLTHEVVAGAAQAVLSKAPNERASVLSTATRCLSLYRDPIVAANTAESDFAVKDLISHERPLSLYLTVPPSDLTRTRPLMRLILAQTVQRLMERLPGRDDDRAARRLLLMLDEFPTLGRLDFLQTALSYAAGYGIKAYLIAQDLSQIYAAYGHDESIITNCKVRVAFTPNKIETARLISEMAGVTTVHHEHRTRSANGTTVSEPATQRSLLTPDEAMRLPQDAALIFVAGHAPIYANKIRYFEDAELNARSGIAVPIHSDRIQQDRQLPELPANGLTANGSATNGGNGVVAHADQGERGGRERDNGADLSKGWPFK
jgi:type IV secretion system protein VirD4